MSFQKEFSEATAEKIDQEVNKILNQAHQRVRDLIQTKRDLLIHVSAILTEKEVVEGKELTELIQAFENPEVAKAAKEMGFHEDGESTVGLEQKSTASNSVSSEELEKGLAATKPESKELPH